MRWLDQYGSEKIILGADVKGTHIAIEGWLKTSEQTLFDFVHDYKKKGVEYVICTDISKDGMLEGPAFDLYKRLLAKEEIKLIASGGISKFEELPQLQDLGCEGVIIGKAIYENRISLKQLENYVINSDN
jgi:phosphoribosylformimino-5-aminoimidazole carboxamide ribotide isomerase